MHKSEEAVLQYKKELEKWEGKREGTEPKKSSVRAKLRQYEQEIRTRQDKSVKQKRSGRGAR